MHKVVAAVYINTSAQLLHKMGFGQPLRFMVLYGE